MLHVSHHIAMATHCSLEAELLPIDILSRYKWKLMVSHSIIKRCQCKRKK